MVLVRVHQLKDRRITVSYQKPVSFDLKQFQSLCLTGVNGSGKTTLLKIIAGILFPLKGEIATSPLFYCGHQTGLKPIWTVWQNLIFRAQLSGVENVDPLTIKPLLEKCGLEKKIHQKVALLSRGQQQQVAFVSGLLSPYFLWVLDEPFVHFDPVTTYLWKGLMEEHCQKGGGIIYTSPLQGCFLEGDSLIDLNP